MVSREMRGALVGGDAIGHHAHNSEGHATELLQANLVPQE